MVIDSSALIALLLGEGETVGFVEAIAAASSRVVSAPTYVETAIVMVARSGVEAQEKLDRLLLELAVEIVPFTRDQALLAVTAYRTYGKGSGHAAGLNFGDCFSYALAKLRGEPVLCKGNDFARTDLQIAP
ncbi:MAG: type II toxin-antitoxin system VapC family toxin [Stellaceae bacterium]